MSRRNNQSLDDLTTKKVFGILNRCDNATEKARKLALLYCRRSDITGFIATRYGMDSSGFVDMLLQNFSGFFDELPSEYTLDMSFELTASVSIGRTTERIPELLITTYILSNDVWGFSHQRWIKSGKKGNYDDYIENMRKSHAVIGEGLGFAGFFNFVLSQENIDGYDFDNVLIVGVELKKRMDYMRFEYERETIIPVPLRWVSGFRSKDGNKSMSDIMVEAMESLDLDIARRMGSIGITTTTNPGDGGRIVGRHGYMIGEEFLPCLEGTSFRALFERTNMYIEGEFRDHRYKLIYNPNG